MARRRQPAWRTHAWATCPCPSCRLHRAWTDGTKRYTGRHDQWSAAELLRLRELAGSLELRDLAQRLEAEFGNRRTPAAVKRRAQIAGLSIWRDGYSGDELRRLFGTSAYAIRRYWLLPGLLRAEKWRHGGRGKRGQWVVSGSDLEAFLRACPWAYDWRRMRPGRWRSLAEVLHRSDPWLSKGEVCRALGMNATTLDKWVSRGLVPHQRRHVGAGGRGLGRMVVRAADLPAIAERIAAARAANLEAQRARLRTSGHQRNPRRRRAA